MKYLMDTDICIYIIKKHPENVLKKFKTLSPGDIGISSITMAELRYGAQKSHYPQKNHNALEQFILSLEVVSFDPAAALHYGHLRTHLEQKGSPIGPLDLMIAAHALSLNLVLVTNNKKEFSRVPQLKVESWVHT